jgi:hypothetical protein
MLLVVQSQGDPCVARKFGTNTTTNIAHLSSAKAANTANADSNVSRIRDSEKQKKNFSQANAGHTISDRMDDSSNTVQHIAAGTWGGTHIRMEVRDDGADIEYDCARGTVDGPISIDTSGRFAATGTFTRQGPGPIRIGKTPPSQPARYTGSIREKEMSLTVILTEGSKEIGTFKLTQGNDGYLVKCR